MAIKKRGDSTQLHLQPGSELEYEQDGLIRAVVVWEGDAAYVGTLPEVGDAHPNEPAAICYHKKVASLTLARIRATVSYIGLAKDPTDYIIEGIGAMNREPIDTHPDFVTKIGGKKDAVLNTAKFDPDTGQFICFPPDAPHNLGGVESYLAVGMNVRRTYWAKKPPQAKNMGKIIAKPGNIAFPPNVKDLLWGPQTYRQVGDIYQISEELLGSGPKGWNTKIYET